MTAYARRRASRSVLRALMLALLFAALFAQISLLACISQRGKRAAALQREMERTATEIDNLELALSQSHNLEEIARRAAVLGMVYPEESQIRVIYLRSPEPDTAAKNP